MSDKVEYSRLLLKRTNTAGVVPTIPPVSATTLNQFTPTDLFVGEMFANVEDDRAWIRTNSGIIEFNFTGSTGSGSTVIPDLTQVLNSGNTTGGFDIVFTSGSKPVYQGLASGVTTQYLGLDASGNTIITTGSTGGSSGSSLAIKSGVVSTSDAGWYSGCGGTCYRYDVTFATPFASTAYTPSVYVNSSGNITTFGTGAVISPTASGFTITYNQLTFPPPTPLTYTWSAIASGETSSSGGGGSGTSGTSGTNGSSGTSGISGLGLFLPLSGGTVTGNTYFGTTSGITIDEANSRIGIRTTNPQNVLELYDGTSSVLNYRATSGGVLDISGSTNLPRMSQTISSYLTRPTASVSMGMRAWTDSSFPGYGKVGDAHLYASNDTNGLNIINRHSTGGTEDYIRFYAGQDANGTVPDVHIQGSGSTRGYVGIGTIVPEKKLHVSGETLLDGSVFIRQITSGGSSTILTIDSDTGQLYTATNFLNPYVGDVRIQGSMSATTISATTLVLSGSDISSSWTSFTPSWTSNGGTQPTIGNGSITAAYKVIGKTCFYRGKLLFGTTTSGGTGAWEISLPFTAKSADGVQLPVSLLNNGIDWFQGLMNGSYGGHLTKSSILVPSTSSVTTGISQGLDATLPFTWGDSDYFVWNGSYEIA